MVVLRVGGSKFYSAAAADPVPVRQEKYDPTKEERESLPLLSCLDEGTVFNGVAYLGAATVNAPKSEAEIHRNMAVLNREQAPDQCIRVSVRVPSCSAGCVVLHDAATMQEIASYEVHRILFYAHGTTGSAEAACFAFTWSHGNTQESAIFQCHVFRCDIPEAVGQVSACFAKAFQRSPPRPHPNSLPGGAIPGETGPPPLLSPGNATTEVFTFEVHLEIKEEDSKGGYSAVPKDRSQFKLRAHTDKQLCLTVQQVSSGEQRALLVERCFGVLVSPGRNVRHADMQLLEMVSMGEGNSDQTYVITGQWDPADPAFEALNVVDEPSSGSRTYMTVAMDLVVRGIQEPVRFLIETAVRIFPKHERFWYFYRRPLVQQFYLNLREIPSLDSTESNFEVISIETSGEIDRSRSLGLNLASLISPNFPSFEALSPKEEDHSDNDEPMLSGTGEVSKDCSEAQLELWADVLASDDQSVMDNYRLLIAKESSCEAVIQRDISRTFPAHDFFKQAGGLGQDSLFRLSKAYAVHDEEMPEEQAFCVLVKLMYDYKLRDLFKDGFENLYMRLYQLNRLMEEQVPELWQHFTEKGVEAHMFGSQWFLTLFTAKFPLYLVFHILDVFLLQGIDTLFQVALALLMMSKKELLQLDFEGILKYFRVSMPKRCRNQETAQSVMKMACTLKVKRLRKYEQEFLTVKVIISDYKQICSQLSQRLEEQVAAAKLTETELKNRMAGCARCSGSSDVPPPSNPDGWVDPLSAPQPIDPRLLTAQQRVRELELELAQTKLAHVEAECRNQDLTHQLTTASTELQASRGSWFHKTLTSLKEVTKKEGGTGMLIPGRRESLTRDSVSRESLSRDAA
ncbi:hypothetical protein B566_EDAN009387 [Ephemera danica]|nr:hypothetical protein B566_EDAN009387 [Ephemera danica]